MVNSRRHVQQLHERFNVNLFLEEFNSRYHVDFKVIEEPNPPEAIIQSKNTTRWVEVTTVYLDKEQAIDLHTYAVEGEKHKPRAQGSTVELDEQFAKQFVRVVKKKLAKPTYSPFFDEHGKGYLVVSVQYPMFDSKTLAIIERIWDATEILDKGFFKSIYIVDKVSGKYKVSLWKSNLS